MEKTLSQKKNIQAKKITMIKNNNTVKVVLHDNNGNNKKKNDEDSKNGTNCRFLISINVFGSSGPLKFVVSGDDHVANVIEKALKLYAREGRLPVLGFDTTSFGLYPIDAGFDALKSSETIGSYGVRNFILCKKQSNNPSMTEGRPLMIDTRNASKWRAWLQKSLSLKNLFH